MSDNERHFLDSFFNPRSVAVVGASRNMMTANYYLTSNLLNLKYPGKIYPVNPNSTEILGLQAYPNLQSITGDVDLAVISVPALRTLDVVKDCITKKVKGVVIIAGGFSETGANGKGLQDEIKRLLKEAGVRVVGPNSLSPMNSALNFIIGFGPMRKLTKGRLSFIFQSGLYQPRLDYLISSMHLNINKLLDLGNKMDINEVDALEYFRDDDSTGVIALHLESIAGDGRRFFQLLKEITPKKPVIVLKSGRTEDGAKAASSHTGAIIKSGDTVVDVALRQAGAIRVQGLDEFFDLAKIFEYYPPLENNRIAIATFSGGEGVIATDFCQFNGLKLAEPTQVSYQKMRSIFPPWDIPVNPFDTGVSYQFNTGKYIESVFMDVLASDPDVDCLAIQIGGPPNMSPGGTEERLKQFIDLCQDVIRRGKLVALWTFDPRYVTEMADMLEASRIPVYPSVERAVRALGALHRYNLIKKRG
ncbi:MAG: CoA-binding protein [Dehalococcoidales bacterium]|nr:CoA-binding protein [Dehalococcoidales bacterium]